MVTRSTKSSSVAKLNAKAPHADEKIHAAPEPTAAERAYAKFTEARDELLKALHVRSWQRELLSFIGYFLLGVAVGVVGFALTEMLMVAALMYTGSVFLSLVVWVLGVACTFFAAIKLSEAVHDGSVSRLFNRAATSVADAASSARSNVVGIFARRAA